MATKTGIAKTISDQYNVMCKYDNENDDWAVNGAFCIGSIGAKVLAKKIAKARVKNRGLKHD